MPAVLVMHPTGKCKVPSPCFPCRQSKEHSWAPEEFMASRLERLAKKGLIAVAFDAPWHGERAIPEAGLRSLSLQNLGPELLKELGKHEAVRLNVYFEALVRGFRTGSDRFVMDISRDALTVVDYLCSRPDTLQERISATGVSLGGMACWLLAAADARIFSAMPAIGVQSFNHSLVNGLWGARVDSIRPAFEAAAADMKKAAVDDDVVAAMA